VFAFYKKVGQKIFEKERARSILDFFWETFYKNANTSNRLQQLFEWLINTVRNNHYTIIYTNNEYYKKTDVFFPTPGAMHDTA
jgi:hypothetical protein